MNIITLSNLKTINGKKKKLEEDEKLKSEKNKTD